MGNNYPSEDGGPGEGWPPRHSKQHVQRPRKESKHVVPLGL